jgi:hypothetical protein
VPVRSLPLVLPMEPFSAPLVLLAAEEVSLQSMWTGLAECSFAAPVSLSASLPALGFLKESQSGFAASFIDRVAELGSLSALPDDEYWDEDCAALAPLAFEASFLLAAMAGMAAPSAAARASVLRNWLRIIVFLLFERDKEKSAALGQHTGDVAAPTGHGCGRWSARTNAWRGGYGPGDWSDAPVLHPLATSGGCRRGIVRSEERRVGRRLRL